MPRHKPIQFQATLEPKLRDEIKKLIRDGSRARSIADATLALAAGGGMLTLAVFAPNAFGAFGKIQAARKRAKREEYTALWRGFHRLKAAGLFEFAHEKDGVHVYRMTRKGREHVKKLIAHHLCIDPPRRWDKKWRLVIFDIPEPLRKARRAFAQQLRSLSFFQCQKSVWIHPFPCLEEIEFLKDYNDVKPFVKLFTVDEMSDGTVLYHFKDMLKKQITR